MGGGPRIEQLVCGLCHQLPKVVMESKCCFSIFCKKCVMNLKSVTDGDCPNCGKTAKGFQLNVPLQRIVDQQEIKCCFNALGCEKVLEFKEKKNHEAHCLFSLVECPNHCGTSLIYKQLQEHKDSKCSMRLVKCHSSGCEESMPLALLELHNKDECKFMKVRCSHCFKELVKKGLQEHIENACPEILISCPYRECGCCDQISRRLLMSHLDKNTKLHLQLVLKVVGKQQQEIASLKNELIDVKNKKVSFVESLQTCADSMTDSTIRWACTNQELSWCPKFNLMYAWMIELLLIIFLLWNGIGSFCKQSHLVVTSFCIFMGYFYLCNKMTHISWFVKLLASVYFNLAWAALLYICL